ncbi:GNAT family N-acetyltransferase [Virgibacillus siamensis]|uniref:GNAT family N-acetyltransferase n=1 Tax=Virgibacillus siamensis TaxID=480071 RepID=UPI000984B9DB|nr:GNAT family protein [Virgibacillus siamensis]
MDKSIILGVPKLETERLLLRKISLDDIAEMNEYGSSDNVSRYVSWPAHQSTDDTKKFADIVLAGYESGEPPFWGIVLKENNKLIGTINFVSWMPKHKTGELGYVLSERYWGRELMSEAVDRVLDFGFREMALVRIQARCFTENLGSEKVMKKVGMTYEGTLRKAMFAKGRHWNLMMYSILDEEYFSG